MGVDDGGFVRETLGHNQCPLDETCRDCLGTFVALNVNGLEFLQIAKPRPLAFGELVRVSLELFDRLREWQALFEVGQHFAVAQSLSSCATEALCGSE